MAQEQERRPALRWDPFGELSLLQSWSPLREFGLGPARLARLMDEMFGDRPRAGQSLAPPVDIVEAKDHYRISAELPGVTKDDLTVEVHDSVLSIRGEKKSEREEEREKGRRLERSYGAVSRSFTLPADANVDQLSAAFENGVLKITVPKQPEAKPKTVAIQS